MLQIGFVGSDGE